MKLQYQSLRPNHQFEYEKRLYKNIYKQFTSDAFWSQIYSLQIDSLPSTDSRFQDFCFTQGRLVTGRKYYGVQHTFKKEMN